MRIVTFETLKSMPDGTVFCKVDKYGNFANFAGILNGKFIGENGFKGKMNLIPHVERSAGLEFCDAFSKNDKLPKEKYIPTKWITTEIEHFKYDKDQMFAVFSDTEVSEMISVLKWSISCQEGEFNKFLST